MKKRELCRWMRESTVGNSGSCTEPKARLWTRSTDEKWILAVRICRTNYCRHRMSIWLSKLLLTHERTRRKMSAPINGFSSCFHGKHFPLLIISRDCYTSQQAYRPRRQSFYETYRWVCIIIQETLIQCVHRHDNDTTDFHEFDVFW